MKDVKKDTTVTMQAIGHKRMPSMAKSLKELGAAPFGGLCVQVPLGPAVFSQNALPRIPAVGMVPGQTAK
jgi:hypothetical protein